MRGRFGERCIECYLQAARRLQARETQSTLMANILLVALDAFLQERGAVIKGAVRVMEPFSTQVSVPATRLVDVAPGRKQAILADGMVFLKDPDGVRHVLRVEPTREASGYAFTFCSPAEKAEEFLNAWKRYALQHAYLRGKGFYADGDLLEPSEFRLSDVCLTDEASDLLRRMVLPFVANAERYQRQGLPAKRGLLLAGRPGTGKSMLCKALSHELQCTTIWISSRHVTKPQMFADIWELARMLRPTVIILEDLDLYTESRDQSPMSDLLGELMNQMDGIESSDGILTIGTTNRLDVIEKALRNRPGRFDRVLQFGALDESARRRLLLLHFQPDAFEAGVVEQLIRDTRGFTGAQMLDLAKSLVEFAAANGAAESSDRPRVDHDLADRVLADTLREKKSSPIGFVARAG